ncbi:MAG: hypothetical protein NVSMB9_36920 [Isosphaeraceae bacterium]
MASNAKGGFLRWALRALIGAVLLMVVLSIVAAVIVREAVSRIHVDPVELREMMSAGVIEVLRKGSPEEKLETIPILETLAAADAVPFVPALTEASKDENLKVRRAAIKALERITAGTIERGDDRSGQSSEKGAGPHS